MNGRRGLTLVLALYVLVGFGYSVLMPVWEAPDERSHYGYALRLAREGDRPALENNYEAFQPPLYYWIASVPLRLLGAVEPGWVQPLRPPLLPMGAAVPRYAWTAENYAFLPGPMALRWMGIGFGALSLLLVHAAVRNIYPDRPALSISAVALAGGIPQFLHITASVNNDVLAILAGSVLFYLLSRLAAGSEGGRRLEITSAAAAVAFPLLIKLTLLPLSLVVLAAAGWRVFQSGPRPLQGALAAGAGGVVLFLLVSLAVPGLVVGFFEQLQYRLGSWSTDALESGLLYVAGRYVLSFWGNVGWVSVGIPEVAAALLTLLAIIGAGVSLWVLASRARRAELPGAQRSWLLVCAAGVGAALLMILRNTFTAAEHQGRFLFPTIGPIVFLVVYGWLVVLGEREKWLPGVIAAGFLLLNLHLWWTGVLPVYYQPFE